MTKQISLCNLLQTAFAWQGFVPPSETNPPMVSRRWEQHGTQSGFMLHAMFPTMMRTVKRTEVQSRDR